MRWNHLSLKLMIAVAGVSLVTIGIFAWISITTLRGQFIAEVIRNASQFSDTVRRSTHHAMLQNRLEDAYYIMDTIAQQEGVARVRIFNKDGLILFSTDRQEVGQVVDKRAESCYACHAAEKPLERLMVPERARIIETAGAARILGMITPIHNESGCSLAPCHAHPAQRTVLGVLDIGLSLDRADAGVAAMRRRIALFAGAMVLLISTILFLLLDRGVIKPVSELVEATERVAQGDLDYAIPVRTADEIGALAVSFNEMTSALKRARQEVDSLVGTLEDRVEERSKALRLAQAQLIQSEKLASLGKLAADVAHELNNPLAGVLTYVKLFARKLRGRSESDAILEPLALVERETNRCISIVRNLLDFARQRAPAFQAVELNAVIREALSLLANAMAVQDVTVEQRLGELPPVWADFSQLRQVFVNIIMNAWEAMQKGGTLTVTSRCLPETGMVEAEFSDTGVGIPEEHIASIFDPFFTTKEKGTGLGLSVVYGIVDRHGGRVEIASRVNQGTTVTVRLPVAENAQ